MLTQKYPGLVEDVQALLRIPSVQGKPAPLNPFGTACGDALRFMLNKGRAMGFSVKDTDGYAGHIGWNGSTKDVFAVLCHLDVVPAGSGWTHQPFGGDIEDGHIYGRGAQDDKAPALAALYALKRLKDEGFAPRYTARLILGLNEESGWKCIEHYLAHERQPVLGFSPDSDFPVVYAEKGVLHLKLTFAHGYDKLKDLAAGERVNMVPDKAHALYWDGTLKDYKGKSAHGSRPQDGDSALHKLLKDVAEESGDPVFIKLVECFVLPQGLKRMGLALSDKESGKLTVNLGTAAADGKTLTLGLDVRYPVTVPRDTVIAALKKHLGCGIDITGEHAPLHVPPDDPLVQSLMQAYRKVTGDDAPPLSIGGATYARALKKGVAFGPVFPGEKSTIHAADECISLDSLYKMTEIYYEALKVLLA